MKQNAELIYTGENFNAVFDTTANANKAFAIAKSVLLANKMTEEVSTLVLDEKNNKIYVSEGNVGNDNDIVYEMCFAIANGVNESTFYGHAFFDDDRSAYESCADYEYENGLLKLTMIISPEGHGVCPECEEQIVCFDEYDPNAEYECEECGCQVEKHEDMFFGKLPILKKHELKII